MTPPDDLWALAEKLDSLLSEVWRAHCDKESPDWNDCEDDAACQWCVETKAAMVDLRALAAAQQTPEEPEPLRYHYSGDGSTHFWTAVNVNGDMELYRRACRLQEAECAVLNGLLQVAHETPAPRPAEDTTP